MEERPEQPLPITRIRTVEQILSTGADAPGASQTGLEVAFYPDRVERAAEPVALTPSQAVRYAEDPDVAAAAAATAGTRQVKPPAPEGTAAASDAPAPATTPVEADRELQLAELAALADLPAEHSGSATGPTAAEAPDTPEASDAAIDVRTDAPGDEAADEPAPEQPPWWEAAQPTRRPSWWRRLLRLGR